jgi:hypothetical protein
MPLSKGVSLHINNWQKNNQCIWTTLPETYLFFDKLQEHFEGGQFHFEMFPSFPLLFNKRFLSKFLFNLIHFLFLV